MADVTVNAEIAGVVFRIEVAVGDVVAADQSVAILESMKMHIPVEASSGGTVSEILVAEGDSVTEGQALIKLA